ncbi:hypothetical protein EBR25_11620 [bacterium]|nr:hypothetical protein [bacterium]
MKREEKSVIQRFLVVLMVVMLLVTPSQGEADSPSTGSRSQSDVSGQGKSPHEGSICLPVQIKDSALTLGDVLYGIRQNQNASNVPTASLFYRLLEEDVSLAPGQRMVSFLVGDDGLPIKAFSESDCGANPGSGNGGSQAGIDPIEF